MLPITDQTFAAKVEKFEGVALVDFWAEWCRPCKVLKSTLEDIYQNKLYPELKIFSLNIEDGGMETATRYGIRSIPTLMIFKSGKVIGTRVGGIQKNELMDWIDSYIK